MKVDCFKDAAYCVYCEGCSSVEATSLPASPTFPVYRCNENSTKKCHKQMNLREKKPKHFHPSVAK